VFSSTRQELEGAKSQVSQTEAEIQYMMGVTPLQTFRLSLREVPFTFQTNTVATLDTAKEPQRTAIADKIRTALDKPASVQFKQVPFGEALKELQKRYDIPIVIMEGMNPVYTDGVIALQLDQVPLGAVFQALEDLRPELRLVVRDYGILVTYADRVPWGWLLLNDFWHMRRPATRPAWGSDKP
jgi:hypothetical protein